MVLHVSLWSAYGSAYACWSRCGADCVSVVCACLPVHAWVCVSLWSAYGSACVIWSVDWTVRLSVVCTRPQCLDGFSTVPVRFKAIASKSKEDLVTQGFTEFTIEDFHNTFMDVIELVEKQGSLANLLTAFNDQSTSDYLVVYLRLLTSGYLQREAPFFQHFIEGGRTVKEFCQQEVEPMAKESDHIHIIALAQALDTSIRVEYMDRGEGGTTNQHIFPEGSEPRVFLLYRPGHYDILYK
ncbi:ubiquitin thioesterase OTUB1-like [Narcine bancroftii]|uniref:ubiquitin thioesterase OTUB1-like n=1 Tax=Narcine bancroftii TaxID=1343680 RepID=UPI00383201AF